MTRPEIIRADTIDLQGRGAHSTQAYHSSTYNHGPLAPHQAETLREVAAEAAEESIHSPRVSWSGGEAGGLHHYAHDHETGIGQAHDNLQNQLYNGGGNNMASRSHQDALAIAQNGGHSDIDDGDLDGNNEIDDDDDGMDKISSSPSIEDDDDGDFSRVHDEDFLESGWGGECLQDTEDIDFEFVYALHTFVATVEGQANATKGDTMVLLDDSNSYWWLVRVVKDSSIGMSSLGGQRASVEIV
ncbi:protein phosphatase regulator [Neurospora sp. IMI 360204]|nr:protein phosphatase regulator [Neurospora sp. IMI 360204]